MKAVMNLLLPFLSHFLLGRQQTVSYKKMALNFAALFLLIVAYIVGCVALYNFLLPHWGKAFSLFMVCVLLIVTSMVFYGIGYWLKPKKLPSDDIMSTIVKSLGQASHHDFAKDLSSMVSPKMLLGVFAAVFVVSYVMSDDKEET